MADADDTALVRGLKGGNPRAAREVWHRFGPMVRRILLRTLGPDSELDDLVQEVFVTFFARVKTLRDPKSLVAFLMSITAFRIRHHLRWRWLRRWLVIPGRFETLDLRTFELDTDAREAVARFFELLDGINATDRTAFTLRFVEQLELREVAAAMKTSVATTKRRLTRTWSRLANRLRKDPALADLLERFRRRERAQSAAAP